MVRRRTASHVVTRRNRPGVSQHPTPGPRARHNNGKAQWGHAGGGPVRGQCNAANGNKSDDMRCVAYMD